MSVVSLFFKHGHAETGAKPARLLMWSALLPLFQARHEEIPGEPALMFVWSCRTLADEFVPCFASGTVSFRVGEARRELSVRTFGLSNLSVWAHSIILELLKISVKPWRRIELEP